MINLKKILLSFLITGVLFSFCLAEENQEIDKKNSNKNSKKSKIKSKIEKINKLEKPKEKIDKIELLLEDNKSLNKNQIKTVYEIYYDLLFNNGKYKKLIEILPEYFNALDIKKDFIKAQVYNEVAFKLATQGQLLDKSIELANKAYKIIENHKKNQSNLDIKKWETNINIFLASVEDTLGLAYYKLDEFVKAEKFLKKSIKYLESASEPHYHLGLVYEKKGNYKKAYRYFLIAKFLVGTEIEEYEKGIQRVKNKSFDNANLREKFKETINEKVKKLKDID